MILSHTQIEEIAAAVTKDFNEFFFGKHAAFETYYAQATPIDQLAGDYLGLRVSFARLSDDGSICGLTAYTDTEYAATCQGVTRLIPLKANEVLLDSSFMEPGQVRARCGKRRFTLAHECAHQIFIPWWHISSRVHVRLPEKVTLVFLEGLCFYGKDRYHGRDL